MTKISCTIDKASDYLHSRDVIKQWWFKTCLHVEILSRDFGLEIVSIEYNYFKWSKHRNILMVNCNLKLKCWGNKWTKFHYHSAQLLQVISTKQRWASNIHLIKTGQIFYWPLVVHFMKSVKRLGERGRFEVDWAEILLDGDIFYKKYNVADIELEIQGELQNCIQTSQSKL